MRRKCTSLNGLENWKIKCAEVEAKRSEFIEAELVKMREDTIYFATQSRDRAIETATATINEQKNRKAAAEAKLASLSIFRFMEKKRQEEIIEESSKLLAKAQADVISAQATYNKEMSEVDKKVELYRSSISNQAKRKFPLPAKPKKPM